jgi:hypothetical protein
MGWNSWDSYGTTVRENEFLDNARFMSDNLLDSGWDTVVVDIAWYDPTARSHGYNTDAPILIDEYGRQLPDPQRFPSSRDGKGFSPLAKQVHALGLKFGVHVMRGIPRLAVTRNCSVLGTEWRAQDIVDREHVCKWNPDNFGLNQEHPGAQAWYDSQVDQLAGWGVDFFKVDDMQTPFYAKEISAYSEAVRKAKEKYGRNLVLSLSPGGDLSTKYVDFLRDNAQMWRVSDDLWDSWEDIYAQFSRLARWAPLQSEGHWADADMLPLGRIGLRAERGEPRDSNLTASEQMTVLTLWSMARSPLMVGGDLPTSSEDTIALLRNEALLEVTAESYSNREIVRERIRKKWEDDSSYIGDSIVWTAESSETRRGGQSGERNGLSSRRFYVALFWTGDEAHKLSTALQGVVGLDLVNYGWSLRNLWSDCETDAAIVGRGTDRIIAATVPPHGVVWLAIDLAG